MRRPSSPDLAGVSNFRDFGGWPTANGRRVVSGRLFRSAHFAGATERDASRLDALGVSALFDLRHPDERVRLPNAWTPGRIVCREFAPTAATPPPATEPGPYTAQSGRTAMRGAYASIPYDARLTRLFAELLRTLAEDDGAVVIHCTVGKDRTGIGCALVLAALGVGRAAIFEDYLATNACLDRAERARLVRADLEPLHGRLSDADIEPVIGVEADYLETALAAIEARSGSIQAYLAAELGVTPARLAQLRERLTVAG